MTDPPIIMSAHSVRAIIERRKTQTRRAIKWPIMGRLIDGKQRIYSVEDWDPEQTRPTASRERDRAAILGRCPKGRPGDRLWVKETWGILTGNGYRTVYRADEDPPLRRDGSTVEHMKWGSPIFMPKHRSLLTLEITEIRVERVLEISEADALAEGIEDPTAPRSPWPTGTTTGRRSDRRSLFRRAAASCCFPPVTARYGSRRGRSRSSPSTAGPVRGSTACSATRGNLRS